MNQQRYQKSKRNVDRRMTGHSGSVRRHRCLTRWMLGMGFVVGLVADAAPAGSPFVLNDPLGDVAIRRTDLNADGFIDPQIQRPPDLITMRIGAFSPFDPNDDRFTGNWNSNGGYLRLDLVFDGLINPPGPVGLSDHSPVYLPFKYGPNPIIGFIEFDIDADENTGGELSAPEFRYLGNVARFGGIPSESRFTDRVATDGFAFDGFLSTAPFVERSGEEFHLVLLGEKVSSRSVESERPGGDPSIFESGEKWIIEGKMMHRAHGFEDFALSCFEAEGRYEAEVKLLFAHKNSTNQTTISLVYPLTNSASAAFEDPDEPVDANDGCTDGQNSVEEALIDLQFSAFIADSGTRMLPEFQLIAGWEFESPAEFLDPTDWQITALLGTAYGIEEPDGARFIWTDVFPNPVEGDFNGDGVSDSADATVHDEFILSNDGNSTYDGDGDGTNGSIFWNDFANNFCVLDVNYDGIVDGADLIVLGDMDLNGIVNIDDVDDFVLALLDPAVYSESHDGMDPLPRGDINDDGLLDGQDVGEFVILALQS